MGGGVVVVGVGSSTQVMVDMLLMQVVGWWG